MYDCMNTNTKLYVFGLQFSRSRHWCGLSYLKLTLGRRTHLHSSGQLHLIYEATAPCSKPVYQLRPGFEHDLNMQHQGSVLEPSINIKPDNYGFHNCALVKNFNLNNFRICKMIP